ncbi:MAG: hypothetical protein LH474_07805 [Chamaesiphon sp.]|nr:hypothetical protein [Chamaesiphon sp.]
MNNLSQESSGNLVDSVESAANVSKPVRISAQELHKYVIGLIGIFIAIVITYPISMSRVAQKEKFAPYKSHVKSLTLEYKPVEPEAKPSATAPAQTPAQVVTTPAYTLERFMKSVYTVAYSPDGEIVAASTAAGGIKFWDPKDRTITRQFTAHDSLIYGIAFSPNGKTLATASDDGTVKLWDSRSGERRVTLKGHEKTP